MATMSIATGNTSEGEDVDEVVDEDDDNTNECLLLHKTIADFGLIVNSFVLSGYLNGEKKQ